MDVSQYVLLGRSVETLGGAPDRMSISFDESHRMFMKFFISNIPALSMGSLLPWPLAPFLDDSGHNTVVEKYLTRTSDLKARFDYSRHELRREATEIVAQLRLEHDKQAAQGQTGKDHPHKHMASLLLDDESLSTDELVDIVLSLVIAGRDTTACLLSWTIYELTQNPDVQKKLCEEVDREFGHRRQADGKACIPVQQDVTAANMPYLNGVIYEALRKWPPVPDDPKMFTKDTVLPGGVGVVKKGTKVLYHPYAMGRNPVRWPEPLKFNPDRWIPFKQPSPYEFPVFQGGPRSCLGRDLAMFEAKVVIAMLVQEFTFELKEGQAELIRPSLALTMAVSNSLDLTSEELLVHAVPRQSS
jgi:cytochrome P450